ncbi:MAG: hypothetical protein ACR2KP_01115 [Egibacteraceae bacterium]
MRASTALLLLASGVLLESPWKPVGHTAELFGVGTFLLAAAIVVLPILLSRGGAPLAAWIGGGALALSFGVQGIQALLSGRDGALVGANLSGSYFYTQLVLLPVVLVAMVACRRGESPRPSLAAKAYVVLVLALMTTHPLVRGYLSLGPYDSLPCTR